MCSLFSDLAMNDKKHLHKEMDIFMKDTDLWWPMKAPARCHCVANIGHPLHGCLDHHEPFDRIQTELCSTMLVQSGKESFLLYNRFYRLLKYYVQLVLQEASGSTA